MRAVVALATLQASSLIQQGHHKRALKILQSSLVSLRSGLARSDEAHPQILKVDEPNVPRVLEPPFVAIPASSRPNESDSSSKTSHQGVFILYDRSLVISVPSEQADADVPYKGGLRLADEHKLLAIVIIYNMALCHHLRGVQGRSPSSDRYMLKAIRLYECALEALSTTRSSLSPNDALARLAILNNLGHAYQHFRDSESSQSCLDQLAITVRSGLVVAPAMTSASAQDLHFFALTYLLHDLVFPTAPAA
jgi:hypothetical protein